MDYTGGDMRLSTNILSDEEKIIIHQRALDVLENVGVKCASEKILDMLYENGAEVDFNTKIIKMEAGMIQKALDLCPKAFTLGARNPMYNIDLPSKESWYTLDGCGIQAIDFHTGERRTAVTQDIINCLKVFEEMDMGRIAWSPLLARDMPTHSTEVRAYLISFIYTSKHVQTGLDKPAETIYLRAALRELLGSDEEIRKRKICSMIYCPVAPLTHVKDMMEAYLELGDLDIPVLIFPMPAAGSTSPCSMYSNIVQSNAEALSSIVIFQLAHPGRALIYGCASGPVNFSTGAFLEGAPEMSLLTGACGEMAKYYGLPQIVAGCLTDAKAGGSQAMLEKMSTTLPLVLSGVDIVQGIGLLEGSMCLKLEQLVVDNEMAQICRQIKKGVEISEQKDFYQDICDIGPGGHYLKCKNTLKSMRSNEFIKPVLCDRNSYGVWQNAGCPDMYSNAADIVKKLLKQDQRFPLDRSLEKVINEIMDAADRELL